MKKVFMLAILGLSVLTASAFAETKAPATGSSLASAAVDKPAPDFTLTDSTGKTHKLSQYQGKTVVLEWVNYDCPFVKKHYGSGNMQALQKKYTDKGIVWFSVISSAKGKQGRYTSDQINRMSQDRKASPTAVLLDSEGKVGRLYGAKTTPHLFVIDSKGTLSYKGAIDDKPSTDLEDIPTAKNYVSSALDELLAGKKVTTASTESYGCSVKY